MIALLIGAVLFFCKKAKYTDTAKVKRRLRRLGNYIELEESQYQRLKTILASDCDLEACLRQKPETAAPPTPSEPPFPNPEPNAQESQIDETSAAIDPQVTVAQWMQQNQKKLEEIIEQLTEQDIFTCELQQYCIMPPESCWPLLMQKLRALWNVDIDIGKGEFHISWFQI